jgi:hypothetical protein
MGAACTRPSLRPLYFESAFYGTNSDARRRETAKSCLSLCLSLAVWQSNRDRRRGGWVNNDGLAHAATANNNDWDVMIGPNKTARLMLMKPGEVDYDCKFHLHMKARVTVAN